jgi:hypothetical protein
MQARVLLKLKNTEAKKEKGTCMVKFLFYCLPVRAGESPWLERVSFFSF